MTARTTGAGRSHQTRSAGGLLRRDPYWAVERVYHRVRWDHVIPESDWKRSDWQRIPSGLLAFADFLCNGAWVGDLCSSWRHAVFFLNPYVLLAAMVIVALVGGIAASDLVAPYPPGLPAPPHFWWFCCNGREDVCSFSTFSMTGSSLVATSTVSMQSRTAPRQGPKRLCEAARASEADEDLVLGHSLGAVLAIDLLDRALRLEPRLGQDRSAVAFISVGSSIPKIGLHRAAARFRAAVERVANAPAIFWAEYQALTDVMSFYKVDPELPWASKAEAP